MLRIIYLISLFALLVVTPARAQMERVPDRLDNEGKGPFEILLIKNATMIDGTGAPPEGPVNIVVQGNRISHIIRNGDTVSADHVIDASGMFILPGFVDTHGHNGDPIKAPQPSYGFKLWLAHGVTAVRGLGFGSGNSDPSLDQKLRSSENTITAPRLFAYAVPGDIWSEGPIDSPRKGRNWVRWIAERGYDGVKLFNNEEPLTFAAIVDEASQLGLGTVAHLGQRGVAQVNGSKAAELGLNGITHFYGHFESLLSRQSLPQYPATYNYLDEQSRFSWVARLADQASGPGEIKWDNYINHLIDNNVTLSPTFNIYSASRDVVRARNLEWHEKYTLPSLMQFYAPSLSNHGSYYHDWTSEDEVAWRNFYQKWFALTKDFNDRGGRVTVGSDPGYIYQTWGFSYISELEMLREAGLHPIEIIQAATINGAREIYEPKGIEPPFGSIAVGKLADLVIIDENPLANLKVLYGTGHTRLNRDSNSLETIGGVLWTIKDGIVYDAKALLQDVAEMVSEQRNREMTIVAH